MKAIFFIYVAACVAGALIIQPQPNFLPVVAMGLFASFALPGFLLNYLLTHHFSPALTCGASLVFWAVVAQLSKMRRSRSSVYVPPTGLVTTTRRVRVVRRARRVVSS